MVARCFEFLAPAFKEKLGQGETIEIINKRSKISIRSEKDWVGVLPGLDNYMIVSAKPKAYREGLHTFKMSTVLTSRSLGLLRLLRPHEILGRVSVSVVTCLNCPDLHVLFTCTDFAYSESQTFINNYCTKCFRTKCFGNVYLWGQLSQLSIAYI